MILAMECCVFAERTATILLLMLYVSTGLNCSKDDQTKCRTDVFGNSCAFNGEISQCNCEAEGFVEADRRTKCTRSYCTETEKDVCKIAAGNDCEVIDGEPACDCYGQFEAIDGHSACRQTNCSSEDRRQCQSHLSQNICHFNGTDLKCVCKQPGYSPSQDGKRCLKESCQKHMDMLCHTELGNECQPINNTDYECTCNGDGFIPSHDNRRCDKIRCTDEERTKCSTHHHGNNCTVWVYLYRCICQADGFRPTDDGSACVDFCSDVEQSLCQTNIVGNECIPSSVSYRCICNATDYENIGRYQCKKKLQEN